jgi:hypothetical protein
MASATLQYAFRLCALALARRGLHVFPCRPRSKKPLTEHGFKDATADADAIARWWRLNPDCNIAIATGAASRVFVLDVDNDKDGEAALRKLEEQHGALPATVEAVTARGRHLYFAWPAGALVRNSAGKLGPGLDVRGEGGYVLAPPSVHPSGRRYAWSVDSAKAFAPAPAWLLDGLDARADDNAFATTPPSEWRELVGNGVEEGQRNHSVARFAGYLLRKHVDPFVALEILLMWNAMRCRPPLDDAEVERIVASICGLELKRRGIRC